MNILVTGGAGYIGSMLVPELLRLGYKVTVIDNFLFRQSSLNHLCQFENFNVYNLDVRLDTEMKKHYTSADIVIPLAGLVGAPLCEKDPIGAHTTNDEALAKMFGLLSPNQLVLMPTTNSAYGSGDADNYCDENSPLKPISKYARDKVRIENILMERVNSISLRLATVFGMSPKMRIDLLVNDFVYRAVNDRFIVLFEGHFKRNYIHVRDVVRAFIHSTERFDRMKGEIFNVGLSDANLSKVELCERIKRLVPDFAIFDALGGRDPDQRNYIVSNEKLEKTGFKTSVSLEDGIRELLMGYRMVKRTEYSNV